MTTVFICFNNNCYWWTNENCGLERIIISGGSACASYVKNETKTLASGDFADSEVASMFHGKRPVSARTYNAIRRSFPYPFDGTFEALKLIINGHLKVHGIGEDTKRELKIKLESYQDVVSARTAKP